MPASKQIDHLQWLLRQPALLKLTPQLPFRLLQPAPFQWLRQLQWQLRIRFAMGVAPTCGAAPTTSGLVKIWGADDFINLDCVVAEGGNNHYCGG